MRVGVAIELVKYEGAQHDHCDGVGPKVPPQESRNKCQLYHSVTKQIPGIKMLRFDLEAVRPRRQEIGDKILLIFGQFSLRYPTDAVPDPCVARQCERQATDALRCRVRTL